MKIAILVNTFCKGKGMDYVAEQQAKELAEEGHKVTIFTFDYDHGLEGVAIEKLNWPKRDILNFSYILVYPLDIYNNLKYSKKLKDYDMVVPHFYPLTFLAYFTKKRYPNIKYIFYNHGVGKDITKSNPLLRRIYIDITRLLTFKTITNTDCVISISQYVQDTLKLKNQNIEKKVIYNKVNANKFKYYLSGIDDNIRSLCNTDGPIFLYVGVLIFYKGIVSLIESFRTILEKYPNAKLLLVGKMSYGFNLYNYVDKECSRNIFYFGSISDADLGFLYNTCDVYVTASTWESFNLPIVEAQMLGKPVVAFDIGVHKEVVKNGETGILVESFDTEKFAEAVLEVYKNKEIMGEKAKKWALKFSIENKDSFNLVDFIRELEEEGLW